MMFPLLLIGSQAVLLRKENTNALRACAIDPTAGGAMIADGFSRVACVQDGSPKDVRLYYKDVLVKTSQKNMDPTTCFNFCRDKVGSRFFMIEYGRDCYCTEYFHDISTGGGTCDLPCEADNSEMCGGKVKASAFEMHMCGKSGDVADAAAASARTEGDKAHAASESATAAFEGADALSTHWQLGVCSKSKQVCDLSAHFEDVASDIRDAGKRAEVASVASHSAADAVDAAKAAGFETAEQAHTLEMAVAAAKEDMRAAAVKTETVNMAVKRAAGALGEAPVSENWEELFKTASSRDEWHAVCDLVPTHKYIAIRGDEPAACADVCIAQGEDCTGFNVQYINGALACQMLSPEGVYSPADAMSDAFGVFEVTQTKVESLGFDRIDCFIKSAFLLRNGGVKVEKIADIVSS